MATLHGWLKRYPVTSFVVLAYAITWVVLAPLVLQSWGLIAWPPLWHALGAFGPGLAAILVSRAWLGRSGLDEFWQRCTRWRLGREWLLVVGSSLGLLLIAILLMMLIGRPWPDAQQLGTGLRDGDWWLSGVALAMLYGLEELGWRGFLQHHLQRRMGVLRAALVVWLVWTLWHLPMFSYRLQLDGPLMVVGFASGLLAGAIWLAYLYNRTGSILAVVAWHGLYNLAVALGGLWSADIVAIVTMMVIPLAVVAVVMLSRHRPALRETHRWRP